MKTIFGFLAILLLATSAHSVISCARCADRMFILNMHYLPFLKFEGFLSHCTKNSPVSMCEDECVAWDWVNNENFVVARLRHCTNNIFNDTIVLQEFRDGLHTEKTLVMGFKNLWNSIILCEYDYCNFRTAADNDHADWGLMHYHEKINELFDVIDKGASPMADPVAPIVLAIMALF